MTDEPLDAAALRERQQASRERIQDVQQRAERAKAELADGRHTATSPDRAVTVTVDAAGTLIDLAFAASIAKLAPTALAHTVLATYRQATRRAIAQTQATLRELVGKEAPVLDLIRASVEPEAQP
jgi:DNA-binding protein YbaB